MLMRQRIYESIIGNIDDGATGVKPHQGKDSDDDDEKDRKVRSSRIQQS